MLPEIKQLIALLGSENLLEKRETRDALKNLARSFDDEYYRDTVLGGPLSNLLNGDAGRWAQEIADLIWLEFLRERAKRLLGSYEGS